MLEVCWCGMRWMLDYGRDDCWLVLLVVVVVVVWLVFEVVVDLQVLVWCFVYYCFDGLVYVGGIGFYVVVGEVFQWCVDFQEVFFVFMVMEIWNDCVVGYLC